MNKKLERNTGASFLVFLRRNKFNATATNIPAVDTSARERYFFSNIKVIGCASISFVLLFTDFSAADQLDTLPRLCDLVITAEDWRSKLNASSEGETVCFTRGLYDNFVYEPKTGQKFLGFGMAELNGSVILDGFDTAGGIWKRSDIEVLPLSAAACLPANEELRDCNKRQNLFFNDKNIKEIDRRPLPGEFAWFLDRESAVIYVGFDPSDGVIKLSVRNHAFFGQASDVTIDGFIIQHYASFPQQGAVQGKDGVRWLIEGNLVQDNAGAGINLGSQMVAVKNTIRRNGQIGVRGTGEAIALIGNAIVENNVNNFDTAWEAGGSKFFKTKGLLLVNNCFSENAGPGIWLDVDNEDSVIISNFSITNSHAGIFLEISYGSLVSDNIVAYNGSETDIYSSQISISGASNNFIVKNFLRRNKGDGFFISIIDPARFSETNEAYLVSNNRVTANFIIEDYVIDKHIIWFLVDGRSSGAIAKKRLESQSNYVKLVPLSHTIDLAKFNESLRFDGEYCS